MVWEPSRIAKNYFQDFFFIDFFCCLPGYPVSIALKHLLMKGDKGSAASAAKLGKAPRVLKVLRSVKMFKVLRVLKVGKFLEDIRDTFSGFVVLYKMLKLLVT